MVICLQCGYEFKFVSASVDELGCHTVCPDCSGSFDIEPRCSECDNTDCEENSVKKGGLVHGANATGENQNCFYPYG